MNSILLAGVLALSSVGDQEPSARELAAKIAKAGDLVEVELFDTLAAIRTPAALQALIRSLDEVRAEEPVAAAYAAFHHFAGVEELEAQALTFLRNETFRAKKKERRPIAARAIVGFGDAALPQLENILEKHKEPAVRQVACDPLVPWLARRGDATAVRWILWDASLHNGVDQVYIGVPPASATRDPVTHREVVRDALAGLPDAETQAAMLERLVDASASRAWKLLLLDLLAEREGTAVSEAMAPVLKDRDTGVVLRAIEVLSARKDWDGLEKKLRPLLRSKESSVRRGAVIGLGDVLLTDPEWHEDLLSLSRSKDAATRMGAVFCLAEVRTIETSERLYEMLADDSWSVRVEVLQRVGALRREDAIPFLIDRLDEEGGRLSWDVYAALRILTGLDLGHLSTRWRQWWEREGERFELPSYDEAVAEEERRNAEPGKRTVASSFYGLDVVSERVCFVLDVSGSMRTTAGIAGQTGDEGTGPTRMDVAKEQLMDAIREIPDGDLFNVVFFESELRYLQKNLLEMTKPVRQKVMRYVHDQYALGGTRLYPALKLAFDDRMVDTIYLLSDGAPTEGEITDIAEIRAEVRRWNSARHVVVHGIAMGQDSTLLWWLTKDTGGRYVRID